MTKLPLPFAVTAFLLLAGCNSQPDQPQVIDTNPDPMASTLANAAPVELPPAIKADKTMRCKDGSLAYVTFFQGDKQAVIRTEKDGTPTTLKGAEAGKPLTAEGGWSMTGNTDSVEIKVPGKGNLSCHA
ncbi:hypothetical protein ASG29_05125 [Sphingomonas sp. Leaf412]|uniref:hypothetical protein n=1 Tax=Sphingomonas sp. Leaf412 TaxID=1736370 RepID=UPI0006FD9573|nr:hypothetical protein [Sphingomonas sp. Leaf412]KQT33432.1 hypothetical protein ASG29_05125 [Sphingomonas sp. Leaf412]